LNIKTKKNKILKIGHSSLLAVNDKYIIFTLKSDNKIIVTNKKGKLLQTIDNQYICFGIIIFNFLGCSFLKDNMFCTGSSNGGEVYFFKKIKSDKDDSDENENENKIDDEIKN
jgi:hypothetical protein